MGQISVLVSGLRPVLKFISSVIGTLTSTELNV